MDFEERESEVFGAEFAGAFDGTLDVSFLPGSGRDIRIPAHTLTIPRKIY